MDEYLIALQEFTDAAMYLAEVWSQDIDDSMGWRVSNKYPFMGQYPYMALAIHAWNEAVQHGRNEPAR